MKKLILLLLFIPLVSFGQVGKKEVKDIKWNKVGKLTNPYKYVELEYKEYDNERTYRLSFQNLEYSRITDTANIIFTGTPDDIKYIKQTLIEGCALKKNSEAIELEIGSGTLLIVHNSGKSNVKIAYVEEYEPMRYTWLSKAQIDKVFGK